MCPDQIRLKLSPKKRNRDTQERERERERERRERERERERVSEWVSEWVWVCASMCGRPVVGQRDTHGCYSCWLFPHTWFPWKKEQEHDALQRVAHWMGQHQESHQRDYRNCAEIVMVKHANNPNSAWWQLPVVPPTEAYRSAMTMCMWHFVTVHGQISADPSTRSPMELYNIYIYILHDYLRVNSKYVQHFQQRSDAPS